VGILFVDDNETGWNAGAIKEVRGQADDTLDVPLADQVAADVSLTFSAQ
jgi:hypothetical protein